MVKENNCDDGDVKFFPKIIGIASLLKNEPSTLHRSENWPLPRSNWNTYSLMQKGGRKSLRNHYIAELVDNGFFPSNMLKKRLQLKSDIATEIWIASWYDETALVQDSNNIATAWLIRTSSWYDETLPMSSHCVGVGESSNTILETWRSQAIAANMMKISHYKRKEENPKCHIILEHATRRILPLGIKT